MYLTHTVVVSTPLGGTNILFLILRMINPNLAPEFVESCLGRGMLTDPAVPWRAIASTLRSGIGSYNVLLIRLSLPTFGGLEHFTRRCDDLFIRG
jgi:hypothetical protein